MGDRKAVAAMLALFVIGAAPVVFSDAFALDSESRITAEDLGILQLAAHDLFNVDRGEGETAEEAIEQENAKLDLSTLFVDTTDGYTPFDLDTIAIGGEDRNRENIMLRTVASQFGETYRSLILHGIPEEVAKSFVIAMFHERFAHTYVITFNESFPAPMEGDTTEADNRQQNLALRTVHDFLPDTLLFDGEYQDIFELSMVPSNILDDYELQQKSSKLDGQFDDGLLDIVIEIPDGPTIEVDLLEADQTFGDQFNTAESFDSFLLQLEDGSYDPGDSVMSHIRILIAKSLNF